MADILEIKLSEWKLLYLGSNFTDVFLLVYNGQQVSIGEHNGLGPHTPDHCLNQCYPKLAMSCGPGVTKKEGYFFSKLLTVVAS